MRKEHAQQEHAHHCARIDAGYSDYRLDNRFEVYYYEATNNTVDSHYNDNQFHCGIGAVIRMTNEGSNVVKIDDASQGVEIGGEGAEGCAEDAGYKYSRHANYITHYVLNEKWHHFVGHADNL